MKKEITYSIESIDEIVELLYKQMKSCSVVTFTGPLGAGKTTLIKRLLARCGVKDVVTSPTFTYMAVYSNKEDQKFYHFDLYRLATLNDFMRAGFDEYLYQPNSWAFIEWPEIIMPLLTHSVCHVTLDYESEDERRIRIEAVIEGTDGL